MQWKKLVLYGDKHHKCCSRLFRFFVDFRCSIKHGLKLLSLLSPLVTASVLPDCRFWIVARRLSFWLIKQKIYSSRYLPILNFPSHTKPLYWTWYYLAPQLLLHFTRQNSFPLTYTMQNHLNLAKQSTHLDYTDVSNSVGSDQLCSYNNVPYRRIVHFSFASDGWWQFDYVSCFQI